MQQRTGISSRRLFIKRATSVVAGLVAVPVWAGGLHGCTGQSQSAPASALVGGADAASWQITLVSKDEAGEPLIVSGTIYAADGATPLEGIRLHVYHTDARGFYSNSDGNGQPPNPRLKGTMRTDAHGRYEFRTINPASYPNSRNPAHIHASASGEGYRERWIDEYWFDGDPFINEETRTRHARDGRFSPILRLTRGSDGVWRGVRDIKLEK